MLVFQQLFSFFNSVLFYCFHIAISQIVCHCNSLPPYSNICRQGWRIQEWVFHWLVALPKKYQTKMKVIGSGKHSSLLSYSNNYSHKNFIIQAPGGSMEPRYIIQLSDKNYKIANNSRTTKAFEKVSADLQSLEYQNLLLYLFT